MKRGILLPEEEGLEEGLINLTPLIDVVFVVLIVFILIAPMVEIDKVDLASASGIAKETKAVEGIILTVKADNTICLNKEPVSPEQLFEKLKILKKKYPKSIPQLFHDKKAPFGTYQFIKNTMETLAFSELDVVLLP